MNKIALLISSKLLTLMVLFGCGVGEALSQDTTSRQSSPKKTTPDPYFNPKLQPLEKPTEPAASIQYPIDPSRNPIDLPGDRGGEPAAPQGDRRPTIGNWDIPRTAFNPVERVGSFSANHSIIREQKGGVATNDVNFQPLKVEPITGIAPKNDHSLGLDQTADPSKRSTGPNRAGITPNNGGDFSADLSNLKKPFQVSSGARIANSEFNSAGELKEKPSTADSQLAPTNTFAQTGKTNDISQGRLPPFADKSHEPFKKIEMPEEMEAHASIPYEPTKLVAMVGNEPIFVGDMLFEAYQLVEKFMPTAPQSIKNEEVKKLIPKLVPKFVDAKLLYIGMLRKLPADSDVNQVLEQAGDEFDENAVGDMMETAGLNSTAEFDAQLRGQGSSLRKLRLSWSQDQLTKFFLSKQLSVDTEVTHQAMLDDYQKRIDEYAMPARARWEQVMIRFDRTSSRKEAEEQLLELRNQIIYGANFAAVAKKSSHGFDASAGGQHDWTTKGALVLTELDQAIFSLPTGKISDKIETADGFHIIRVLERTAATHKPFLEAQVEIKERILDEKRNAAFEKYLKQLRQEIQVEYFLGNTPPGSA